MQYPLDIGVRPFATFETFVHPEDNGLLAALKRLTEPAAGGPRQYFIWGAEQTGKSHLLQAVCNRLADTDQNVIYIPCDKAARFGFRILQGISQFDVVCIDDVDGVLGDKGWDQALFHVIDALRANNKSLVMTSTTGPTAVSPSSPDLASRLVWGAVYKLSLLTDEQKEVAVQLHARVRGIEVPGAVCSYLVRRYRREMKKLLAVLNQLDERSMQQQRKVTVPLVKSVLENA